MSHSVGSWTSTPEARSATNYCKTFLKNEDVLTSIGRSGAYSFIASTLLSLNPMHGVVGGVMGMVASLVDSAVSPIFDKLFKDSGSCTKSIVKMVIVLSIVNIGLVAIAPAFLGMLEIDIIGSIFLNIILGGCHSQSTISAESHDHIVLFA